MALIKDNVFTDVFDLDVEIPSGGEVGYLLL